MDDPGADDRRWMVEQLEAAAHDVMCWRTGRFQDSWETRRRKAVFVTRLRVTAALGFLDDELVKLCTTLVPDIEIPDIQPVTDRAQFFRDELARERERSLLNAAKRRSTVVDRDRIYSDPFELVDLAEWLGGLSFEQIESYGLIEEDRRFVGSLKSKPPDPEDG